jgi:hypothetical protein
MTIFCPDGYVPVQEAIAGAALHWYLEQITTIETAVAAGSAIESKSSADINAITRLDALTRSLGRLSVSEDLMQQFAYILTQVEHRLRNYLHQRVLAAYYFGDLFHPGRQAVASVFWATTEADEVIRRGTYQPLGKRRTLYEQERPSYPLFFLESELAVLLSEKLPLPNAAVATLVNGDKGKTDGEPLRAAPKSSSGLGAKTKGIVEAVDQLYPNGIPEGLAAKDRNNAIINHLRGKGYSVPKSPERAIQRVLKQRSG